MSQRLNHQIRNSTTGPPKKYTSKISTYIVSDGEKKQFAPTISVALEKVIGTMLSIPPFILGYPGENTLSNYYSRGDSNSVEGIETTIYRTREYSTTKVC